MSDRTYIPPAVIWTAVTNWMSERESGTYSVAWFNRDKGITTQARYAECIQSVIDVVQEVLVQLPIEGARHWIEEAPQQAQENLWKHWVSRASLSGHSLEAMKKHTKNMLPSIMVIVWTAWAKQSDLSMITREEWLDATARGKDKLPTVVREALKEAAYHKYPNLAPSQIRTINQLSSGRR